MEVVDKESLRAVRILNSEVHILNLTEILKIVEHWIDNPDGRCRQIVVTGFHGLWEGYRDPELRAILNGADLWVPDGIAPVAIARMRGYRNVVRTPGVEIMKEFLGLADREGHSSYFYGDTDDTLDRMRKHLEERYPGHRVAGTFSPPFRILSASEDDTVTARINDSEPDIVWVGLGMPKQDRWAYEHKSRLNAKIVVGGGVCVPGRKSQASAQVDRRLRPRMGLAFRDGAQEALAAGPHGRSSLPILRRQGTS